MSLTFKDIRLISRGLRFEPTGPPGPGESQSKQWLGAGTQHLDPQDRRTRRRAGWAPSVRYKRVAKL